MGLIRGWWQLREKYESRGETVVGQLMGDFNPRNLLTDARGDIGTDGLMEKIKRNWWRGVKSMWLYSSFMLFNMRLRGLRLPISYILGVGLVNPQVGTPMEEIEKLKEDLEMLQREAKASGLELKLQYPITEEGKPESTFREAVWFLESRPWYMPVDWMVASKSRRLPQEFQLETRDVGELTDHVVLEASFE
jgi:hypothetical protein